MSQENQSQDTNKETMGFQTEVKQLLQLMIHSLYSNKEIFLRELVSNASDAADKLRFEALENDALMEGDSELKIKVEFDKDASTVSITDNGIGMSRDEVIAHLGTIAKSGTSEFLKSLSGDQKKDASLIGQFGVGFYSAFVVADKVDVFTRRAGVAAEEGVHWQSKGEGDFEIATVLLPQRGTKIVLHLREEDNEFADDWRLKSIIRKYSDHISLPIIMDKEVEVESETDEPVAEAAEGEEAAEKPKETRIEEEVINKATALWTRPRSEVEDEEYTEFYKHISHDFEEPLSWSHNKVEGKLEYTSLLYVPKRAPYDLNNRDAARGLKLYVQRVFIMDDAEQFMPLYLRFIKGVVDSNDLPLNVSREILQSNAAVESMRGALVKRSLDMLSKIAKNKPEDYATLWEQFGQVLKEGPAEDYSNREKIAGLLRFASTEGEGEKATVGLADYVERMKEGQDKIYYITAESYQAALNSPHLEIFRKKGVEVILMVDRIDEWMMSYLQDFDGKSFQHVGKGDVDLDAIKSEGDESEDSKEAREEKAKASEDLVKRLKESLKDSVSDVRVSHRLTDSPACLVLSEHDMGFQMQEIMKATGQAFPGSKPALEVNPDHPLIERLDQEVQEDRFESLAQIVYEQASLAEGRQLDNPGDYVRRINKLLLELSS